jgi:hypothetical protein
MGPFTPVDLNGTANFELSTDVGLHHGLLLLHRPDPLLGANTISLFLIATD